MNSTLNLLHSLQIVQAHKVKAQAVKIIFLYPIGRGINHKFTKHISLGCRIVSTAACRGICARRGISVIIVRNYAVKRAVCIVGMIINYVHNNTDARLVKCRNHLLVLFNSYLAVKGVGRIATLGNVIVLRVVAPVERGIGICLVNRCIIIYGKQMNVRNTKLLQVIYTNRYAMLVFKSRFCKRKILALVL